MTYIRKTPEVKLGPYFSADLITCKCPMCEKIHKAILGEKGYFYKWIGNGMPRKYCSSCKKVVASYGQRYDRDYREEHKRRERKNSKKPLKLFP